MFDLAVYLHDIDPFALHVSGNFGLRWYGLSYLAGFAVGFLFTWRITTTGISSLKTAEGLDFVINVAIGVVAGGRLGYVVFYKPQLLVEFYDSPPFWGVFQLGGGGMSSHGGMIGVAFVVWLYARRRRAKINNKNNVANHPKCRNCRTDLHGRSYMGQCAKCQLPVKDSCPNHNWLHLFDFAALTGPIGFFFGRIANFINAELVGRPCADDFAWAVKYPQDMRSWSFDKLMELRSVIDQVGYTAAEWTNAIVESKMQLIDTGVSKLILAIQAGGEKASVIGEAIKPMLIARHPSQLYAAFFEGFAVFVVLAIVWMRPRKPGMITGLYGVCYGIGRIINEQWRTPDAHIASQEFDTFGITRGQWLSVVLVMVGIAIMVYSAKKEGPRMGGWLKVKDAE